MNIKCGVYDLQLLLKSRGESEYAITETFKGKSDTYIVNDLRLELVNDIVLFSDCDEVILNNGRAIMGMPVNMIKDIKINDGVVVVLFTNSDDKIKINLV